MSALCLPKEIAKAGEEQQKRISKGLFRYAVELELIMKILADEKHFSKEKLEEKDNVIYSFSPQNKHFLFLIHFV